MSLKKLFTHGLVSVPGWHTNRHIIVFESDDWGAIRMPSLEAFNYLKAQGVSIGDSFGYDSNDTLASDDDLELLMEVLSSYKDKHGNPVKITLNTCVANPDFKKIKDNDFQKYYYEPFTETLKRYPHHEHAFDLWKEGMRHNVFRPQFHGREHLNAQFWMQLLKSNIKPVKESFEKEVFSMDFSLKNEPRKHVLSAFNVSCKEEYEFAKTSITEGLNLFDALFGFRSLTMIAPCYTWDTEIEEAALLNGIGIMQGGRVQIPSVYAKSCGIKAKRHFTGQKDNKGMVYLVRTSNFEPTQSQLYNADNCMKEIEMDFRWHKPAIVSCHRLNFIGGLNPSNRDNSLREFNKLLRMIVAKYPDIEFMSSDELGKLIINK